MKALRLMFAILLLTVVAGPLSAGFQFTPNLPGQVKPVDKECLDLCARVLCAEPQVCGPYTGADGKPACGCH
jgi:hypothetical protein